MGVLLSDIRKSFGDQIAVDGVAAEIGEGEFFVILGPSGCGKSTLLRLIAGLERADGGEIAVRGRRMTGPGVHLPPEARDMGVVFQSYALWPHMTVLDNVAFPVESAGRSRRKARHEAGKHLGTVSLEAFRTRRPAELSGGQRQRVALARCLAGGARTVLMDEPLANLDPHLRASMEEEIAAFHRRAGTTTIYITHDQREAMALASRVAVMARGRFQQVATPQELYDRPATAEIARFIGRSAILPGALLAQVAGQPGSEAAPVIRSETAMPEGGGAVVVRPGDVRLGQGPLTARLERIFYRGGLWEGLAVVPGLPEPLPVGSRQPLVEGSETALTIERGWRLPEAASETPRHDPGRQAPAEPVE